VNIVFFFFFKSRTFLFKFQSKGEALAAHLGLAVSLASSLGLDHFILGGDSKVVIFLALRHPDSSPDWRISSIIDDTLDSIPFPSSCKVRKVN
jgi:hypothetical protein